MFAEFPNTKFISETSNRCKNAKESIDGVTPGICETVETVLASDQSTRIKGTKTKGIIIKYPSGFRIGCEQDLEATVKQKSFNLVCSNPPPHSVRSFQDLKRRPTLLEPKGATQARQPTTYNQNITVAAHSSSPFY